MRKSSLKIIVMVLCLAAAAALFSGCGSVQLAKPTPRGGVASFSITGSCDISIEGNVLTVSGETNIMDGAFINVSVMGQNGMTVDSVNIVKSGDSISQKFEISDKYKDIVKIKGYITCAPTQYGKHPDEVYNSYGEQFEYITASTDNYIWGKDGIVVLFDSEMIDVPKN